MAHNHLTRDIKPEGRCPGCDEHYQLARQRQAFEELRELSEELGEQ